VKDDKLRIMKEIRDYQKQKLLKVNELDVSYFLSLS